MLSLKQIGTICFAFIFSIFSTNLFATDPNIAASATTANCDNATLETYSGSSNLQANWEANKINLTWYSDDTQITDVQSAATSCNYDSGLTVPSTPPTKTGYTFNGWKVRGLPEGYTHLEYIQSNGAQYIDTGVKGDLNTKAAIKFVMTGSGSNVWYGIFGARQSSSSNAFNLWAPLKLATGQLGVNYSSKGPIYSDVTYAIGIPYVVELSKNGLYINNKSTTISNPASFTTPSNIYLFDISGGGTQTSGTSVNRKMIGKIYYFRLYSNNTLVREFIPAKNSSNVVGMYDTVSKTFFTNAGSGSFTAGPVVQ